MITDSIIEDTDPPDVVEFGNAPVFALFSAAKTGAADAEHFHAATSPTIASEEPVLADRSIAVSRGLVDGHTSRILREAYQDLIPVALEFKIPQAKSRRGKLPDAVVAVVVHALRVSVGNNSIALVLSESTGRITVPVYTRGKVTFRTSGGSAEETHHVVWADLYNRFSDSRASESFMVLSFLTTSDTV